ncbi:hypothetical protein ACOTHJ_12955 [Achromobacter xylosoxidans]|uniref:hypothetical protein n=1 Tax=Achromobacter anxifer TaxID=1287737 RepID=UPI00155C1C81|nr:hypothetical protein [Achromobacter anxifer]CAB5514602.1 hypothetical protein LMG26857_03661 [Achromobacter anxifer]
MKTLNIDRAETDLLVLALQVRICHIETGTSSLRANDAIAQGNHKLVKALEPSQRAVIADSEALIKKLLQS